MGMGRIAVALAATAALTACASVVEGSPKGERPDPTKVAGLEISNGPSGPKPGVPDADLSVENGDGGEMDQLAINTLADVQEFSYKEIAAMLSIPLGTVMSRLNRGRTALKTHLTPIAKSLRICTAEVEQSRA